MSDLSPQFDFPMMLAAKIVLVLIMWNGFEIWRWEGIVLLAFYVVYAAYLVLDGSANGAADAVGPAALIATPLVLLTFAVTGVQGWRRHRTKVAAEVG